MDENAGTPGDPAGGVARGEPVHAPVTTCYRHPDRVATLACSRCGRPICGECMVPVPVGQLCPDDAAQGRVRVRGLPSNEAPVITWAIIAINAVMLLIEARVTGSASGLLAPSSAALCRLGGMNAHAVAHGQYWRLFTAIALHDGLIHFAVNSWALYVYGPILERAIGRWRYLALYLGCGFAASAASFGVGHTPLSIGASGAIFGVIGALLAFFWRRRRVGGQAAVRSLVIVLAINAVLTLSLPFIDKWDHIGGFVAGVAAMAVYESFPPRDRTRRLLGLALPFALGIVLAVYGTATIGPHALAC